MRDGQQRALEQRALHVGHRDADRPRVVAVDLERHARAAAACSCATTRVQAVDHVDGVLALRLLHRPAAPCAGRCRAPGSRAPAGRRPRRPPATAGPARRCLRAHDDLRKSSGRFEARVDLHHALVLARADRAGRQLLVLAAHGGHDLLDADAQRLHRRRAQVDVDLALARRPPASTEPTPRTFSRRFCSTWSAQVVSSCALRAPSGEVSDSVKIGWLAGSKRETRGSLTSSRSSGRIARPSRARRRRPCGRRRRG